MFLRVNGVRLLTIQGGVAGGIAARAVSGEILLLEILEIITKVIALFCVGRSGSSKAGLMYNALSVSGG
jgi:hypothetical protein